MPEFTEELPLQTKAQREARARRVSELYPTIEAQRVAKAKRVATLYLGGQEAFDRVMGQFSPHMKKHVLKRVLPHLTFAINE